MIAVSLYFPLLPLQVSAGVLDPAVVALCACCWACLEAGTGSEGYRAHLRRVAITGAGEKEGEGVEGEVRVVLGALGVVCKALDEVEAVEAVMVGHTQSGKGGRTAAGTEAWDSSVFPAVGCAQSPFVPGVALRGAVVHCIRVLARVHSALGAETADTGEGDG